MKLRPLTLFVLTVPCAYIPTGLGAATDAENKDDHTQPVNLETLVISATRTKENISDLPYSTQVVESKDIIEQAQAGMNLGQILGKLVPGMGPGDSSATSYYQSLRGREVLVLIDGVAQRSGRNISRQLKTISPENIERVEIISGATAIYGAGATGGIINIITKRGSDQDNQFGTTVGMTVNTENTEHDGLAYLASQRISGMSEDFDYLVNLSYEKRGNYYDADGEQIATDPNQVSRDNSDTLDVLTNLGWEIDDQRSLRLSLAHFKEEQDTEFAADFGEPNPSYLGLPQGILGRGGDYTPTPRPGLALDSQPLSERNNITLDFSDQDFFGHTLLTQFAYRYNEYYFYPYPSSPLYLGVNWSGVVAAAPTSSQLLQRAIAANLTGASGTLFQSRVETNVYDLKMVLDKDFSFQNGNQLNLAYGLDYTHDVGNQKSIAYGYDEWVSSGQITYSPTGAVYDAGPETTNETYAAFLQSKLSLGEHWTLRAGVRYETTKVEVEDTISGIDIVNAEYYQQQANDPAVVILASALGVTPQQFLQQTINGISSAFGYQNFMVYSDSAALRSGGSERYSETLYNVGVVYDIDQQQEIFANYSEGFTVPDMTRLLRSLTVLTDNGNQGPILEGTNIDAVTTNSYDVGWRGRFNNVTAQTSVFYNYSDHTVDFDRVVGAVNILDQKERFWGVEALIDAELGHNFSTGLTYAKTYGQTQGADGNYYDLGVDRVSPEKITGYIAYRFGQIADTRLQVTSVSDYTDGHLQAPDPDQVVPFDGYQTYDLIANFYTSFGTFTTAIHNLTNESYYSVYNQVRGYPSTGASAYLADQGRNVSLSYSVDY